jgi:hypothetical protein
MIFSVSRLNKLKPPLFGRLVIPSSHQVEEQTASALLIFNYSERGLLEEVRV